MCQVIPHEHFVRDVSQTIELQAVLCVAIAFLSCLGLRNLKAAGIT